MARFSKFFPALAASLIMCDCNFAIKCEFLFSDENMQFAWREILF